MARYLAKVHPRLGLTAHHRAVLSQASWVSKTYHKNEQLLSDIRECGQGDLVLTTTGLDLGKSVAWAYWSMPGKRIGTGHPCPGQPLEDHVASHSIMENPDISGD